MELGLDLGRAEDRFKWFIASILFAKRISSSIAKRTFKLFIECRLDSLSSILNAGWDRIVDVLDDGGYVRYDFSTASNILEALNTLRILTEILRGFTGIPGILRIWRGG